ncbi:beta-lactamase domain-containing protein [Gloeothece citriformis PCC 7424]|uniref:Beta-lactamase domain-containing protein n=1 Tax=Gloeothece citriformis (strain PCC 7424) TaxID=65393 RepID=B7KG26_GLOC7|nr:FAD/NAD(P)-binding protein [Gloeothece citriformis]ACK69219.1 beta-lactamase domain-containing protein [Gloeothece citriformis PCC 7424]
MSQAKTIAIIGGGFSGSMVAIHLLKQSTYPLTIKLIEPRPPVDVGVAYSTPWSCHLLNVPVGEMSAFTETPDHFWQWLQGLQPTVKKDAFVPRHFYSQYIRFLLTKAQQEAQPGVKLEWIGEEAIAVKPDVDRLEICLNDGETIAASQVVLALGNFPPGHPNDTVPSSNEIQRYFTSWEIIPILPALNPNISVILLGSGLTMLDIAVALHHQKHQGKIYVVSRRGLLPQPHQSSPKYADFLPRIKPPTSIRELMKLVRQEITQAQAQGYDWRSVMDALRPHTQTLWQSLPLSEKQRFLRHVRPYWEIHRHRAVPQILQTVKDLIEHQQLTLIPGRVQNYEQQGKNIKMFVRPRGRQDLIQLQAGIVINCTGPECDYRQLKQPIVLNLLTSGLVRPDPLHLGLDVANNGALINASGKPSHQLYTLGPPQKGCLWETTAIREIRQQAQHLAQILLKT